jgi:mono/diheme cytochrome c family protein
MQFMLVKQNGPEKFRQWEDEFRDVFAYLSSIEPPKYSYPLDNALADSGRLAFNRVCAECHGTYGENSSYPERLIPIDVVGTDRARLDALSPAGRDLYGKSWFAGYGTSHNVRDPGGYVAPPLGGIWASAPYFHNGSVPTLWHVLHPGERPVVWKRQGEAYDPAKVGPQIETYDKVPAEINDGSHKREFFNTRSFGKSAAGHEFPNELSDDDKRAVLEYLKTL